MTTNLHLSGFATWGRAPALWQKEVAREVERLLGTARPSIWVESWDAGPFNLCPEPLLGRTLGEILGVNGAGGEDSPGSANGEGHGRMMHEQMIAPLMERSEPNGGGVEDDIASDSQARDAYVRGRVSSGPHITDRRPGPHARLVQSRIARGAGVQQEHIDLPSDAPRRADAELLMRLAGQFPEMNIPRRETGMMPRYSGGNRATPPRPGIADHRVWIDILGGRASESLRTGGMGIIPGKHSDPEPGEGNLLLAESLSIPLDGPRAPADLLAFLSELKAVDQGALPGGGPGYGKRHQPGKGELVTSGEVDDLSAAFDRPEPFDPVTSRHMGALHKTGLAKTALEVLDSVATEARIEAVFSPPGPTMLPPMLPRRPAEDTPVPIASDLSLLEAMRESSQAGEDLGILAAKIKRILDEEARRYGIDV